MLCVLQSNKLKYHGINTFLNKDCGILEFDAV